MRSSEEVQACADPLHCSERELLERVIGAPWTGAAPDELGLSRISRWSRARMELECGMDGAGATRLCAAFELGRRVETSRPTPRTHLLSPRAVWELVMPELRGLERETFLALVLDGKHRLQRQLRVSEGTLNTSLVHPREVFSLAVRENAGAVIVVHNHPSGDPEPSVEDVEVTRRLIDAGWLLGIPLIDHVVVADAGYVSLRERMSFAAPDPPA